MVDTVEAPTAQQSGAPISPAAAPDAFGLDVAGALGKIGAATQDASDSLAQAAEHFQQINNAIASNDATQKSVTQLAQARENYRQNFPGMAAGDPKNMNEFYGNIDDIVKSHTDGLSPTASAMYLQDVRRYAGMAKDDIITWAAGQRKEAGNNSAIGLIETAKASAVANIDDPSAVQTAIKTIGEQAALREKLNGWEPGQTHAYMQEQVGSVWAGAVTQAYASGDTAKALQLFQDHKQDFTEEQAHNLGSALRTSVHANEVQNAALAIVGGGTPGAGSTEEVFNRGILPQESSSGKNLVGQRTPFGTPVGEGQTLPATAQAMAQKLGIPWQPNLMTSHTPDALAYQRQLAHAYWEEGLSKEGGDTTRALMYYYGGPDEAQWGAKTHQYAADVMARVGVGSGQSWGAIPFNPKASPETNEGVADQYIIQRANQLFPTDAQARMQVIESARTQSRIQIQMLDGMQKDAYDRMDQMIVSQNIGDPAAIAKLDPTDWNAVRPEYQSALESKARYQGNLETGTRLENAEHLGVLYARSQLDPDTFLKTDVRAMDLTNGDQKKFIDLQAKVSAGQATYAESDKVFNHAWKSPAITTELNNLGINNTAGAASQARLQGLLKGQIDLWTQDKGKPPSDKDLDTQIYPSVWRSYAAGMGGTGTNEHDIAVKSLGLGGNTAPNAAEIAEETVKNRDAAIMYLRSHGNQHPTVSQVEDVLTRTLAARGGQ